MAIITLQNPYIRFCSLISIWLDLPLCYTTHWHCCRHAPEQGHCFLSSEWIGQERSHRYQRLCGKHSRSRSGQCPNLRNVTWLSMPPYRLCDSSTHQLCYHNLGKFESLNQRAKPHSERSPPPLWSRTGASRVACSTIKCRFSIYRP